MSIFPSDQWIRGSTDSDSGPMKFAFQASLPSLADQATFSMLVVVTWLYEPDSQGMPQQADSERMASLMAAVWNGTEARKTGFHVASLTGQGRKEWRFYAMNAEDFIRSLNADLEQHEDYPLQIGYYEDHKWLGLLELQALAKRDA